MRSHDPADSGAWGALRRVRPHRDPMYRPTAMDVYAFASENPARPQMACTCGSGCADRWNGYGYLTLPHRLEYVPICGGKYAVAQSSRALGHSGAGRAHAVVAGRARLHRAAAVIMICRAVVCGVALPSAYARG